jgi:hypothetical protein
MNPQPPEYIGHIYALVLFCVAAYYFLINATAQDKEHIDLDKFIIGYFEDSEKSNTNITINNGSQTQQNYALETSKLYLDCIDALCSLGMKKSEAKKITKSIFNTTNPPESIQQFLMIALRK